MGFFSDIGNFLGDVAPVAGTVIGGVFGGPAGAAIGGAIGGGLGGYQKTHHLGGTLEGAALGGAGGAIGGYLGGADSWAGELGAISSGGASASPLADATGLLTSSAGPVSQTALGLGTNMAPGYILPSTGSSLLSDLASGGGSSLLGNLGKLYQGGNLVGGLAQLYGAHQASMNAQQLMSLIQQGNAFGPYRAQYAKQLQQLMQNPGSISSLPGFQAGQEAINRDAAAKGYFGSGNMAASLGMYGNQLYQQQVQNLSNLAGVGINPASLVPGVGSAGRSEMSGLGLLSSGINTIMQ